MTKKANTYRFHIGAKFTFTNPLEIVQTLEVTNIAIVATTERSETQVYMTLSDQGYNHTPTEWAECLSLSDALQVA